MVRRIVIASVIGFLSSASCLVSQEREPCNTEVLMHTERHLGNLSDQDWALFFNAIDPLCKGDARFMGWVNELLYKALASQPSHFMYAFVGLPRLTQRIILDELSAPGHDGLDAPHLYEVARDAAGPAESKQRILQALTKAGCRCDTEILQ